MCRRYFGRDVEFAAPAPILVYSHDQMLLPFSRTDRRLVRILKQHADVVVAGLPPVDAWEARVRMQIARGLHDGAPDLERVARACGVTGRTLRRRLTASGTSYRALVDAVRQERALQLLAELDNVSSVAQQIGFSDASAFARAFDAGPVGCRTSTCARPSPARRHDAPACVPAEAAARLPRYASAVTASSENLSS